MRLFNIKGDGVFYYIGKLKRDFEVFVVCLLECSLVMTESVLTSR